MEKIVGYVLSRKPARRDAQTLKELHRMAYDNWKKRLEAICETVNARRDGRLETRAGR
jgi:hypothetical protein